MFCARASGGRYLGEAVFFIPREALVCVFACEFADEPAMAFVEVPLVFKHPYQVVAHIAALGQRCAAVHCLLGGTVLAVACGVVAEGPVGALRQWAADTSQCAVPGLQDASTASYPICPLAPPKRCSSMTRSAASYLYANYLPSIP